MILVHKPLPFSPSLPSHHRRLPSAPAVVLQPTRTPGLLSIIPKGPSPRLSQQRTKPQSKAKVAAPQQRTPQPLQPLFKEDIQKTTKPHVEAQENSIEKGPHKVNGGTAVSPDKSLRGRQNKPGKDKPVKRSLSLSSARTPSRRQPRQPSPFRNRAEAPVRPMSINSARPQLTTQRAGDSNVFDPFLANSSDTDTSESKISSRKDTAGKAVPPQATPKLSQPSGKLAHRRQHALASPTPSRSIPVPRAKGRSVGTVGLSRSAPVNQGSVRTLPKRSATDMFPICDDMTDIDGEMSRPSTPVRKLATWQQQSLVSSDGPKTAPLSSTTHSFPFNFETPSPSPTHQARQRRHVRAPSEGVFNMSLDEDSSSSDTSEELKALFAGTAGKKRRANKPSKEELCRTEAEKAAYFASSMFQNSPSPDALPAPAFMH